MIYFEALHEFVIPTYISDHLFNDDLEMSEMSSVTLEAGDIFSLVEDPKDEDYMMLCWIEHEGNKEVYNVSTSLSLEFLKINPIIFNEVTQQVYRDTKIDRIVNA